MAFRILSQVAVALLAVGAHAQAPAWAQCGGNGWSGATTCVSGYSCSVVNEWYHQCQPGAAATTASARPTTLTTSATRTVATTTGGSPGSGGGNPGPTLVPGWFYIRAVAAPNFHSYLQAQPTGAPGDAHLGVPAQAGQFQVEGGQVSYSTGSGAPLYLHVTQPETTGQRTLLAFFAAEENTYGRFALQGDTLVWSTPDIARPNTAAWLVCGDGKLVYVNTGAYGYDTPAGCADQTIHTYGGSTPD